ncbi:RES family NAD+ phosphorylase [Paeniglutamicibacter antarcticus]|uniref:RES family NAD+ phosphorylase n=1 Tax=Arthrobacter terrae TaxID=2935737 RepID=A0A931CLG9_9MICC|nr:RES family NAD+ phosphorylase [Arthrobacter terrae]MBG0738660.1 RES family NAD+ phosphorylase [Arthrobacter terrae]
MLAYRVFPHLAAARMGKTGSADYLYKRQGGGRIDNPAHYDMWYLALTKEGAIGETFGNVPVWSDEMFDFPALPGSRRALATFSIPDGLALIDLDDAQTLLDRHLRPTQVISRNRPLTQTWALKIFEFRNDAGERKWAGVKWWSFQRPQWSIVGIWVAPGSPQPHRFVGVEELTLSHPSIVDAATSLSRTFR